ncbi:MAG: Hsp20/alpha crystallin family protein [Elusimicrobia bacterium]|jgi:HSP20 family protein|nr:Hsp20/alpha crystallin family protein [Elusimicrobiota bacterium]
MANTPVSVKKSAQPVARAPVDPWRSLRTEMDRLLERFAGPFGLPAPSWTEDVVPDPAAEVVEDKAGFHVSLELPGMAEKDVEITIEDDMLSVRGEKKRESEHKEGNEVYSERSWGMFQRSFLLPETVDRDKVAASFAKGVLKITLPKSAKARETTRKIEVKPAA